MGGGSRGRWRSEIRWEEVGDGESADFLWEGTGGESQLGTRGSVGGGWRGESQLETCGRRMARVSQMETRGLVGGAEEGAGTRGPLEDSRRGESPGPEDQLEAAEEGE
jgi:hypothetical protein